MSANQARRNYIAPAEIISRLILQRPDAHSILKVTPRLIAAGDRIDPRPVVAALLLELARAPSAPVSRCRNVGAQSRPREFVIVIRPMALPTSLPLPLPPLLFATSRVTSIGRKFLQILTVVRGTTDEPLRWGCARKKCTGRVHDGYGWALQRGGRIVNK